MNARFDLLVLTQNVLGGGPAWPARKHLLARRIRRVAPDVVGLQEVHASSVRAGASASQAHELAALVGDGTYHVDFAPGRVADDGACEGVALLCRSGIRERSVESLTLDREDFLDRAGQRVVLCAMLDLPFGPIDVFVTHLSLSRRARVRTMKELMSFTSRERRRSRSVGAVLLGDFNALPGEEALALLGRHWSDVGARAGATWPALVPFRRIDYVFVQPHGGWRIVACAREPLSGSDHLGLSARVRLTPSDRAVAV